MRGTAVGRQPYHASEFRREVGKIVDGIADHDFVTGPSLRSAPTIETEFGETACRELPVVLEAVFPAFIAATQCPCLPTVFVVERLGGCRWAGLKTVTAAPWAEASGTRGQPTESGREAIRAR